MSKPVRVAINGFGRIGRMALRVSLLYPDVEIVAINDLASLDMLAHLLRYDSVYGPFDGDIDVVDGNLIIDGNTVTVLSEKDPAQLPWGELSVDVVLECTGVFRTTELARPHITAGARRVILSAPPKDEETMMFVMGANDDVLRDDVQIFSNASCTTNSVAPLMHILNNEIGIEKSLLTTIHSYTADQRLVDAPHSDLRRSRSAALNIIPTSTGAAKATCAVVPEIGEFDGMAVRVPTPVGSMSDITFLTSRDTTAEEVNCIVRDASRRDFYNGIVHYCEDPIVSSDIVGSSYSAIFDADLTRVSGGNLVKVVSWYDNEVGYSHRLIEQAVSIQDIAS